MHKHRDSLPVAIAKSGKSLRLLPSVAIAVLALVICALAAQTPIYRELAYLLQDTDYRITARMLPFEDIVVVDVDEASLIALESQLGAWPYDRDVYGEVAAFLLQAGARQIGFDILMSEPRVGDKELGLQVSRQPSRMVFAAAGGAHSASRQDLEDRLGNVPSIEDRASTSLPRWPSILAPVQEIGAHRIGLITIFPDSDGVLRRSHLLQATDDRVLPSLALELANGPDAAPPEIVDRQTLRYLDQQILIDENGAALLKIPKNPHELTVIPFYELVMQALDGPHQLDNLIGANYRDKDVLIGSSAIVLGDFAAIPYLGRTSGLLVQAYQLAALRTGATFNTAGPWILVLSVLLVLLINSLGPWLRSGGLPEISCMAAMAILSAYCIHLLALLQFDILSSIAFPLLLAAVQGLLILGERTIYLNRFRNRIAVERDAAKQANELKSRFLATVTHELRTPLAAIDGYNRIIAERPDIPDAERLRYHQLIDHSAKNLLLLINNLLDQSRLQAGHLSIEPEVVHIRELIQTTLDLLQPLADDKQLYLKHDVLSHVPAQLQVDPARLRQIMINLIGNALKFTQRGGVTLTCNWNEGILHVEVSDTGPGIPKDSLQQIFEAFRQSSAKEKGHAAGTGLGLSISRSLVSLMQGELQVRSESGAGSQFSFHIPAAAVEPDQAQPGHSEPYATAEFQKQRLLLVDDNEELRQLIGLYLSSWQLQFVEASDGQSALEQLEQWTPDLVLLDLLLPDLQGQEVARAMRRKGYRGSIIALSAHADGEEKSKALEGGCNAYLQKPVEPANLNRLIREQLSRRSARLQQ